MNVQTTIDLNYLNSLDHQAAYVAFLKCSGSEKWSQAMAARRPFSSESHVRELSEACWTALTHEEWLLAFQSHPKIGDMQSLKEKFHSTQEWARNEQGSVAQAPETVLKALAAANTRYEEKFGHIFIVCASGKSAEKMLQMLEVRLQNSGEVEFAIACGEQKKITQLRVEKLSK